MTYGTIWLGGDIPSEDDVGWDLDCGCDEHDVHEDCSEGECDYVYGCAGGPLADTTESR